MRARRPSTSQSRRRDRGPSLLAVSHPAITSVNQEVYRELERRGWDVTIVLPNRWRHDYSNTAVTPRALAGLEGSLRPTPVAFAGRQQRHVYLTRCRALCAHVRPDVAFVEAEPYALASTQWRRALLARDVPFGVQCYENIDRPLPSPVKWMRAQVLRDAAFVAARSQSAAELARNWGARGAIGLAPPAVPAWERVPTAGERPFTVGFAGRLVENKGLLDLLAAVRRLQEPVELILIGNGTLRGQLDGAPIPGSRVRVLDQLSHASMAEGYAQFDVLVLPSRTTATWKEQLGRALIEALWCGVPVIGSDSGEIPWVIGLTGGGTTFPEGDVDALAAELTALREDPALRQKLAQAGRAAVEQVFSVAAATDALEQLLVRAAKSPRRAPKLFV